MGMETRRKRLGAKAANKAAAKFGDKLKSSPQIIFLISGVIFKLSMARAVGNGRDLSALISR